MSLYNDLVPKTTFGKDLIEFFGTDTLVETKNKRIVRRKTNNN